MYLKNIIRNKSDRLVEVEKKEVNSENILQVQYFCRRESNVSARDLAPFSECSSENALN